MITAVEALRLPSARLTEAELAVAQIVDDEIDRHIRACAEFRGCDLFVKETSVNIIAEVNQRLKLAGYQPVWTRRVERNTLDPKAPPKTIGYDLSIAPTDDAYRAARFTTAS